MSRFYSSYDYDRHGSNMREDEGTRRRNLSLSLSRPSYEKWDIVMVEFGQEYDCCLIRGYRPAIVYSDSEYNEHSPIMQVIPLTRKLKGVDRDYHVFLDKKDCIGYESSGIALQQRAFIRYVAQNPFFYQWYPLFVTLLGTGCRIGEIVGLRWDDVDMENRVIHINHNLTYYPRADDTFRCEFRVSDSKTEAGIRDIPMMGPVYDVLQSEFERQQEEWFCEEVVDGMTNFIFTNRFGMPHNPNAINRAIKRIVDAHNAEEEVEAKKKRREPVIIPRFSCHIFRHTFASRLCEKEDNIKVIQEIMGHADVTTTMNIYAEVNDANIKKVALENLAQNMDVF